MERAKPAQEALVTTLVEVNPAQLREMANLLELSSQKASPTDSVVLKFTERISLVYKPGVKVVEQMKERGQVSPSNNVVQPLGATV